MTPRHMLKTPGSRADVIPVNRAEHAFRVWLREENYSPRTRDQYLAYVRRARIAVGPLSRASAGDLRAWWSTLPSTAASRNAARTALVAYYRHRGGPNPALELPVIPEANTLPRPVATDVYHRLFEAASDLGGNHEMLYALLAYTGCRIGEARTARRALFDLHAARWRIVGKGSKRRGPKERVIAVHPDLVARIASWPEPDWIFPSPGRDQPVHRTTVGQWWRELVDHAGVRATAHQIRHTVATLGLERSRDIRAVQELLGHASLGTTQRYTLVTGERLRTLVTHLGPEAA